MNPMYKGVAFSPNTFLAKNITAADTSIEIENEALLPDAPNYATISAGDKWETILYAVKAPGVLSGCTRGVEGAAKAWYVGDAISRNWTAQDHDALINNITALDADKADAVHTHALADVTGLADNLAAKDTAIANQSAALDAHAADAGLHVTAAKQAAWDAKADESVPAGGATGQILAKASDADYDAQWTDNKNAALEARVEALETALFGDVTANPFIIALDSLDGLEVTGIWNSTDKCLEC